MNTNPPNTERTSDSMRIFIYKDQKQVGPLTLDEALTKEREGALHGSDNAWIEGEQNWLPLSVILRRFGPPPPPGTVPPPPPVRAAVSFAPDAGRPKQMLVRRDAQEFGPYSTAEIPSLMRAGNITTTDYLKFEGENDWYPATECIQASPAPFSHLWLWFMITTIMALICLLTAIGIYSSSRDYGYYSAPDEKQAMIALVLFYANLAAGYTLGAVMVHRGWKVFRREDSPITPTQAMGLLFVPLFQLYWQFVAVRGLAIEMNKHPSAAQKPVNVGMATTVCISICVLNLAAALAFQLLPWALVGFALTGSIFWKPVAERIKAVEQARKAAGLRV